MAPRLHELRVGVHVVGDLRHEAPDVDGVGAGEHGAGRGEARPQLGVGKDALDLRLGVVEVAADAGDGHVGAALAGHLQVLDVADLAVGVEDGDAGAGHVGKALEGGLAGVAGGGGHDHDVLATALARHAHQARQHLQRHVLEGAGGAMVELEQPVGAQRGERGHGGGVEVGAVGAGDAGGDLVSGVVGEQRAQHVACGGVVVLAGDAGQVDLGLAELVGHVQAAVGGDAGKNCLLACYDLVCAARAVIQRFHGGHSSRVLMDVLLASIITSRRHVPYSCHTNERSPLALRHCAETSAPDEVARKIGF